MQNARELYRGDAGSNPAPAIAKMKYASKPLVKGICFRCEYRAQFLEKGHAPRCECGMIEQSKIGCYCYRPVAPVVLARDKDERRSVMMPETLRGRSHGVGIAECDVVFSELGRKYCLYATPKGKKKGVK